MTLSKISSNKCFDGDLIKYKYKSSVLGDLDTSFNLYLPPASRDRKVPVLVYLAGLTCTEDTGAHKAGLLGPASREGLAILFPDTSPRGANVQGEDDDWDFGTGAGFYLDATAVLFSKNYNVRSLIVDELPRVTQAAGIPVDWSRKSIFGHSMGGHGAITLYLQSLESENPFLSASAFAPILNPVNAPWGIKAFNGYLKGGIEEAKLQYDATELVKVAKAQLKILIDVGTSDQFYQQKQLLPENFREAVGDRTGEVNIRFQDGYDHGYYFISTFSGEHVAYHSKILNTSA